MTTLPHEMGEVAAQPPEEARAPEPAAAPRPLVLDLDGTLCRTDTLWEALFALLARNPLAAIALLPALRHGRAAFKHALAGRQLPDPGALIYNDGVLALARGAHGEGRPVWLATAADRAVADLIADRFDFIEGVVASDGETNLKSAAKAAALVARFGERGFDYAGDSRADRAVWRTAHTALLVDPPTALAQAAAGETNEHEIIGGVVPWRTRGRRVARTLRVHQWSKNLLLLLPALGAHQWNAAALLPAFAGMAAFSLVASSVYVLNDVLDLPHDRRHRTKRHRPFAAGTLPLAWAPILLAITLLGGLVIGAALPFPFLPLLAGYYAATLLYSFVLKRRVGADIITLAGLYTIRVFAGGAACAIPVSPWLLAFSMFLFFCLAVVKRLTELVQHRTRTTVAGRGYHPQDIDMLRGLGAAAGSMAVLVLALYLNSPEVRALYPQPEILWLLCPLLLFWMTRLLLIANRGDMHDDPVVFAFRDRASLATLALAGLIVAAGAV